MKSILICSPAFDGKVTTTYALSLLETVGMLRSKGHAVECLVPRTGSLLVAERNRLLQYFWKSKHDYVLCVDADLGWPAEAVLSMLSQEKEFVCGVYPARDPGKTAEETTFLFRPALNPDQSIVQEKHLLKMEYVPAGFMLIHRSAIAKIREKFPELYYCPKDPKNNPEEGFCLFDTEVYEGEFWGEDYVFCRRARQSGIDIWCDPFIEFDHAGTRGMMSQVLNRVSSDEEKET
jgi:hypothetical protein